MLCALAQRCGEPATWRLAVVVVGLAFVLGGLTSLGQTYLPADFHSLANSSSGWTLPTATLVLLFARSFPEAAIGGALSFVSLTIGYSVSPDGEASSST